VRSAGATAVFAAAFVFGFASARAADEPPYLGSWSNGRGETLVITEKTIRLGDGPKVAYRDVTRGTDGSSFELQITAPGKVNGFPGKTLGVTCESDEMEMTTYASHAAYMQGDDPLSRVTW